jgi:hypothetical protein
MLWTRETTRPVRCPFCGADLPRPEELEGGLWYEFAGGFCGCGAVFALDPTTRNGGAVMLQAMVMAVGGDWDRALSLAPGEDYQEARLVRYNEATHRLGGGAFGTLYLIRLRPASSSPPPTP